MNRFIADLHIHSRFSMATSKQLTLPHLSAWAMIKGIDILGTGDFTHPKWRAELKEGLLFDEESGFYKAKEEPQKIFPQYQGNDAPFFCLQAEISSIYKRGGKVRKVHNLVFMPTLEAADRFSRKLAAIGNIESDGRPILGLDSHDLLEIVLETSDQAFLIPAHIWTPWFSLFGSRSGFDSIEECFADLSQHIFALETGLSSDPFMNRHVSALDRFALISNSDAHSGPNLGRESNIFLGKKSYSAMFSALQRKAARLPASGETNFLGTLEIYPEEWKYHLDGHRECHVVLSPEESDALHDICPVCGKKLTIGVLHRVWELSDRKEVPVLAEEQETHPILPLPTILAEVHQLKATSKAVTLAYEQALCSLGSEFSILDSLPIETIAAYSPKLAAAIDRVRTRKLFLRGGFDGEFGTVKIFPERESNEPQKGNLFELKNQKEAPRKADFLLTAQQEQACCHQGDPLLVLAGPGSGKTRVLIERIARLLEKGEKSSSIIALTFSRRAAEEMRERLRLRFPEKELPFCGTFHALAWKTFHERHPKAELLSEEIAQRFLLRSVMEANPSLDAPQAKELAQQVTLLRERKEEAEGKAKEILLLYTLIKQSEGKEFVDFTDLLEWMAKALRDGTLVLKPAHVLVDEIQDLSPAQIDIVQALLPEDGTGFFGIGDPDQSIYSFRGAIPHIEEQLKTLFPSLCSLALKESFRSSQAILDVAGKAMQSHPASGLLQATRKIQAELHFFDAPTQASEAIWIAEKIKELIGSTSSTLLREEKQEGLRHECAPSDIAILVRLKALIPPLAKALRDKGIPLQIPSEELFWHDETIAALLERIALPEGHPDQLPIALTTIPEPQALRPLLLERQIVEESFFLNASWEKLVRYYAECGSWQSLLEHIRFLEEEDLLKEKAESVRLLTIHAAKGLEFRAVFLPALEDGILPLSRQLLFGKEEETQADEERRLFYTALTRASQALFLSRVHKRRLYNRERELAPSPFLHDILDAFTRTKLVMKTKKKIVAGSLF